MSSTLNHRLRGAINSATMALYVAQKQLERGAHAEAHDAIRQAIDLFEKLQDELRPPPQPDRFGSATDAFLVEDKSATSC